MSGRPREFDREKVLDRAMLLFWERGYDATSIGDLTTALGIGRQSLYGAFGDKRRLFVECLERYVDQVIGKGLLDQLDAEGSALGNIYKVLDLWEAYAKSPAFRGCLLGKSLSELGMRDDELDAVMLSKINRMQQAFERALQRAKADHELNHHANPKVLARALTAFAEGAAILCQVWRSPDEIGETLEGARALLSAYLPDRGKGAHSAHEG